MKLAITAAFQAFVEQTKQNVFERAKKTCEKQGYQVTKKPTTKKEDK